MALNKTVKIGGAYYEGFSLIVGTTAGAHVLDMVQTSAVVINSISVTPDAYGDGDTFTLSHMNSGTTATRALIAKNISNLGANLTVSFDFTALESMTPDEPFRLTYTKSDTASPVTIHTIVEYGGLNKTS